MCPAKKNEIYWSVRFELTIYICIGDWRFHYMYMLRAKIGYKTSRISHICTFIDSFTVNSNVFDRWKSIDERNIPLPLSFRITSSYYLLEISCKLNATNTIDTTYTTKQILKSKKTKSKGNETLPNNHTPNIPLRISFDLGSHLLHFLFNIFFFPQWLGIMLYPFLDS